MLDATDNSLIDRFDQKILAALAEDGRLPITELAKKTGMSKTACGVRMKRLIEDGVILGFRAVINPSKLDMSLVAFVEVKLRDTTETAIAAFNDAVQQVIEVEQCHLIAGSFDYLIKVRTRDIQAYRHVLGETISTLPYVTSTSTYVTMQAVKEINVLS